MSFCPSCGNQLNEGAKFCQNCGKTIGGGQAVNQPQINNTQLYQQQYQQPYQPYAPMKNIVQQLSGKIKVQAIIWLVIACIQYVLGIVNIVNGIDMYYDEEIFSMIMGILIIIVAVLNTVFSIQSFTYSTKILTKPTGIVSKYRPIGGIIGTLIYNILFGGLIGVVGSIYAFVVRSFVMANELQFAQIEQQCMAQAQRN